ncbi:cleavage and polyadenylation specificity factor subunit 6 isoform X2 [Mycetomoellerius zeteki]|uniref:cleavage and polyadenylation specificity factor subunit 6 isoform X2 n=1 Tax=Mycetomoellerius zeteki TaxID=64791 RepID=UPI00084E76E6|nr:PREDICTED: cleavage and polyadenylation specificity factor subunit 6-like isoform X2 [Trachymyrmex zeteki]
MTNSVPDRWLEYNAFGDVIKGTKILAFKVPLKDAIARNLQPAERFTTTVLLEAFPHLKYIIDLTNTCRYYDKKEFTNAGVKYEKIAIPGRKIPTMDIIKKFFKVMDDFTSTCGEDELIGVHCTHGVNRTGYLICRYLIQQLGWDTQDSLKAFGEARGYPIERDIYLTALQEVQRGEKIDTNKIVLMPDPISLTASTRKNSKRSLKNSGRPMGPPIFAMPRRGFANGRPFSSQRFARGIAGPPPGYGPMPPPPSGMPPIPLMSPPLYGPRPFRYGPPPIRPVQAMPPTPPGPGFPRAAFPPRMPGPPRMAAPPRLSAGPAARLPPPKMPPPLPPPKMPPPSRSKQLQIQKKQQIRNGIMERSVNVHMRRNGPVSNRSLPKVHKEQDFTVDTFEENLLTTSNIAPPRRQTRGRFNRAK